MRKMPLLAALAGLALPAAPLAAIPVFDATNYAQNLLQAARALEQIDHQIQSLQNEAAMLRNMDANLRRVDFPELERLRAGLGRIDGLIGEARSIELDVGRMDARYRALFPGASGTSGGAAGLVAAARRRLEAASEGLRESLKVQAGIVEAVREDGALLADLSRRSQAAEGALQASQAGNQLLALAAKQQMQLQALLAAQFRSEALDQARRAQAEADGREATRRFLGSGRAYTPPAR